MTNNNKSSIENDMYVEKRMLATLYNQPEFLKDTRLDSELFSSFSTKNLYQTLINLSDRNVPFSRESVYQEFITLDLDAEPNVVDAITGPDHEFVETIDDIVDQLKDCKKRRSAISSLRKAIKELETTTRLDNEGVDSIMDKLFEAEDTLSVTNNDDSRRLLDFETWFKDYEEKGFGPRIKGKPYKFRHFIFDNLIPGGPVPGELGVLASATGSGKTTLATNLANALIEFDIPLIYCSLEMSAVSMMDRLLSKTLKDRLLMLNSGVQIICLIRSPLMESLFCQNTCMICLLFPLKQKCICTMFGNNS
jgi:replicative DNA helicase